MHICSSYAKILGEKLFRTWELPRSGSKAKNGEKRKKEERRKKRTKVSDNNGQATHDARKPPGPKKVGENNGQLCFCPPPRVAHAM